MWRFLWCFTFFRFLCSISALETAKFKILTVPTTYPTISHDNKYINPSISLNYISFPIPNTGFSPNPK